VHGYRFSLVRAPEPHSAQLHGTFPRKRWFVLALSATSPLTALSPLVAPLRSSALAPPRHLVWGILREDDLQACRREPERAQETDSPPRSTRCPETGLAAEDGHARRENPAGQDLPRVSRASS
jgi:hypothetical protein